MANDTIIPKSRSNRAWTLLMSWTGRATAIVGLCGTLAGGVTWVVAHQRQQRERAAELELAQTQAAQGEYQASVATYAVLLRSDPLDRSALNGQLNAGMLWAENFSVLVPEDQSPGEPAGHALDQIMSILESGLTRNRGSRAADVEAHLGWAHWLNQHIAEREFDSAAVQEFRSALAIDPLNVYANAMLGNWMLQNGGDFVEAVRHFHVAAQSGKALPFVQKLELGGLTSYDHPGARRELIQTANAMRLHGNSLDPEERRRVFAFCCDLVVTSATELTESLSAVSTLDAWQTYLWLDSTASSATAIQALTRDYIQGRLLEISGDTPQALVRYRAVQQKLRAFPDALLNDVVDEAIRRMSQSGHGEQQ